MTTPIFSRTAYLPNEERSARIVADWNVGDTTIAKLSEKWGSPAGTIKDIIRRARLSGVKVIAVDPAEGTRRAVATRKANQEARAYETAASINDLTTDAYRIVACCRVVANQNVWDSTIPIAEIRLLNEQSDTGRIFATQAMVGGRWVRLARIVRIVERGRR